MALGVAASTLAERAKDSPLRSGGPKGPPAGERRATLATFRLAAFPTQRLLGTALQPLGLLAVLAGGAIEGEVWTDGAHLIVEVRRAPR